VHVAEFSRPKKMKEIVKDTGGQLDLWHEQEKIDQQIGNVMGREEKYCALDKHE
jgi:hypothetical protein